MTAEPAGFELVFQEFIYYAGPIIQLLFWIILSAVAVWAVLLFRRLVKHSTASGAAPQSVGPVEVTGAATAGAGAPRADIEEFVD